MSMFENPVSFRGRKLNWRLLVGSNVVLFLISFFIVDLRMNDDMKSVERSGEKEVSVIPVTVVPDMQNGGKAGARRMGRPQGFRMSDIWESLRPWQPYIRKYAREYDVDPDLVSAILYIESKGIPDTVSRKGAIGLMQITPVTAVHLGVSNVLDPEENIKAGVKYIATLIRKYDESSALLIYNAGQAVLERDTVPRETKRFVERVLFLKSFLKDGKKRNDLS